MKLKKGKLILLATASIALIASLIKDKKPCCCEDKESCTNENICEDKEV